ncbi:MAG: hypothetical protein JKY71_10325 [Alphaproteobacteria bacterium]|nr:hypothetical protein [Alphaproteobacteria bacterium]
MKSVILIQYILKAAIRDRLLLGVSLLLVMAVCMSMFMGSAAVSEQDQFAAVFAAGSIRLLNAIGLTLFIVFFIRRCFEMRDIEFMLSRPIGRLKLVLTYSAGFSVIAALLALLSGLCVIALSPHMFSEGHILWTLSLIVENIIIANVALFFSMILTSAASCAFACLGYYVLARMSAELLGVVSSGKYIFDSHWLELALQTISALMLPRLDLLTQTSWLVYGLEDTVGLAFVLSQGAIYSALAICAALLDMRYRQF